MFLIACLMCARDALACILHRFTRIMKELRNHLSGLIADNLREICRGHPNLPIGGNKPELVDRILPLEVFILKKGVVPDNYTVDDIKCLLRGHKWTIGEGKKEDFIKRYLTNLKSLVELSGVSAPAAAPTAKPGPAHMPAVNPGGSKEKSVGTLDTKGLMVYERAGDGSFYYNEEGKRHDVNGNMRWTMHNGKMMKGRNVYVEANASVKKAMPDISDPIFQESAEAKTSKLFPSTLHGHNFDVSYA